jgi:seryl-tRNA synthetase
MTSERAASVFDIKAIRDNPAAFDEGLKRRGIFGDGEGQFTSAAILKLDEERRAHVTRLQEAQAQRNAASKEIGAAKKAKDDARAQTLMAEVASLKDFLASGEQRERELTDNIETLLALIPNSPRSEVPDGSDETGNVEVRRWGGPAIPNFKPKQHFELGEALGLMDFETAAKVSGARFVYLKGALARLERALTQFMLDTHTDEFGYTEVNPPLLVRDQAAYGTANLPKFAEDLFKIDRQVDLEEVQRELEQKGSEEKLRIRRALGEFADLPDEIVGRLSAQELARIRGVAKYRANRDEQRTHDLWLIPTAEVSLTNLVREQILEEDALPLRFTAGTPCFRAEAGSAGRDVRGMIRQHQFMKVELVSITTPEKSTAEHERMTKCAETILQRLGLPYRTMLLCTGDMGFASQKTYDIEVWLPGQDTYREISSCSICGDFQARRMGARYRPKGAKDVRFVHTLNGSGLAVGRTLIAVMENYQQPDGSILVPEPLRPLMNGLERITRH